MPQPNSIIRVISPFAEQDLFYETFDNCISALASAIGIGGFTEAEIGRHRIEVYTMDGDVRKLRQTYYSEFISDEHLERLRSAAVR